ncbi:UNVERIFIED_CONTAM: hypothetical protein FKN15_069660 [Acipenser sinensis]
MLCPGCVTARGRLGTLAQYPQCLRPRCSCPQYPRASVLRRSVLGASAPMHIKVRSLSSVPLVLTFMVLGALSASVLRRPRCLDALCPGASPQHVNRQRLQRTYSAIGDERFYHICSAFQPRVLRKRLARFTGAASPASSAEASAALGTPASLILYLPSSPVQSIPCGLALEGQSRSRSRSPTRSSKRIGCGYNGYVTGATYGNFSREGRSPKGKATAKATSLVHAEANALLLRSQKDLDKAVLYSSKIPCVSCQLLIEAKGITKVISIDDPKEKKRDTAYTLVLYKVGSSTPATSSSTPASSSSTPAISSSTPASSSSTPAISSSTPASSSSTPASSSSTPAISSSTPASSSSTPAISSSTPASSSSTPASSSSAPASSSSTPATSSSTESAYC